MKNLYYSYLRKNNRLESLEQQQENRAFESQVITVEEKMLNKTDAIHIHRILHEMQEPYKEVFSLRIFGELSFKRLEVFLEKRRIGLVSLITVPDIKFNRKWRNNYV